MTVFTVGINTYKRWPKPGHTRLGRVMYDAELQGIGKNLRKSNAFNNVCHVHVFLSVRSIGLCHLSSLRLVEVAMYTSQKF